MTSLKFSITNWEGAELESIELSEQIFSRPIRKDILARVVHWQQAKKRSGNHKTKGVSEVSGTTRKPWRQKGTGRARQGSLRSPQFRKGGIIFGPVVRDHGYQLPKAIRRLGLMTALAARFQAGKLVILDDLSMPSHKTRDVIQRAGSSTLMVCSDKPCRNLSLAIANIAYVNIIPSIGLNVLDILSHDRLILSKDAVQDLEKRLCQNKNQKVKNQQDKAS